MRNRSVFLFGLLVLLAFTSSIATAEQETVSVNYINPGDPFPTDVEVTAVYEGNNITVEATGTLPDNFDIQKIYYITNSGTNNCTGGLNTATDETWNCVDGTSGDVPSYFKDFPAQYLTAVTDNQKQKSGGPIELYFEEPVQPIAYTVDGFAIVVHVGWEEDGGDKSSWVGGKPDSYVDPSGEIPEFPSIILPVAAIMGIMFVAQNRRRKGE